MKKKSELALTNWNSIRTHHTSYIQNIMLEKSRNIDLNYFASNNWSYPRKVKLVWAVWDLQLQVCTANQAQFWGMLAGLVYADCQYIFNIFHSPTSKPFTRGENGLPLGAHFFFNQNIWCNQEVVKWNQNESNT